MKIHKLLISAGFLLLLFTGAANADPPENYPFVAYDEGLRQAANNNKKILLYYGRYGCGYCGKVNIETFSDKKLRKQLIRNYVLVYLDGESGKRLKLPDGERITEMEMGARLNVFSTPVFLYMEPDGKVIFRAPGYKTVKDFMDFDRYIQGGHYKHQSINAFLGKQK